MPFLIITSFFVVVGILVLNGKGTFLISGYNRMSKAEKEKYDEAAICKFVGKMMLLMSLAIFPSIIGSIYKIVWLFNLSLVLVLIFGIYWIIYTHKWKRFKRKDIHESIE